MMTRCRPFSLSCLSACLPVCLSFLLPARAADHPAPHPVPHTDPHAAPHADPVPATQPDLNDLLHLTPGPGQTAEPNHVPATRAAKANARKTLEHDLQRAMTQHPGDLFTQAVAQMASVSSRIKTQRRIDILDRREQKQIIEKLDQVIAAARKRQQGGGGRSGQKQKGDKQQTGESKMNSGGKQPGQPRAAGNAAAGKTPSGQGDHGPAVSGQPLKDQRTQWGNLPPRLRDQLSDGLQERFSPLYQKLTEDYYKKLAQSAHDNAGGNPHD